MNSLSSALVPVLILLPVIDWIATALILRLTWMDKNLPFLTERAIAAIIMSCVTTVFALIFLNTETGGVLFSQDWARLLGRLATLVLGIAPIVWLIAYVRAE